MDEEMLRLLGLGPPIASAQKSETNASPSDQCSAAVSSDQNAEQVDSKVKPSVVAAAAPSQSPQALSNTPKRKRLLVKPEQIDVLCDSLTSAAFCRYGNVFVHSKSAVTLELKGSQISVDAKGLCEGDVYEFLRHELEADSALTNVGKHLLEAINGMRTMASAEADPETRSVASLDASDAGLFDKRCMERLPSSSELSEYIWPDGSCRINGDRQLLVFSYGDKKMKKSALRARGSQVTPLHSPPVPLTPASTHPSPIHPRPSKPHSHPDAKPTAIVSSH